MNTCNEIKANARCTCNYGETRIVTSSEILCCGRINNENLTFELDQICRDNGWAPTQYQTQLREYLISIRNRFPVMPHSHYTKLRCNNLNGRAQGLYRLNINDHIINLCGPTNPEFPPGEVFDTIVGCYEDTILFHSQDNLNRICEYDKYWNLYCIPASMYRERPREGRGGECGRLPIPDCGQCPDGTFCSEGRCRLPLTDSDKDKVENPIEEENEEEGFQLGVAAWVGIGILGILFIILGLVIVV